MQHAAQNLDGAAARYRGLKVPVTGGLGFIGSNLALRLVDLGAQVTVVDPSVADCGANPHNLSAAPGVRVIAEDIANAAAFAGEIRGSGVIFNLAGEISHIHSMQWPARDAALNATGQLKFIGECARQAPGVRIVYASTRQIYGAPEYLPVDEDHRVRPVDFNGIHKYAATQYHLMYSALGMIDATVLCLTNVHGPRMALHIPCQGLLGNFRSRSLATAGSCAIPYLWMTWWTRFCWPVRRSPPADGCGTWAARRRYRWPASRRRSAPRPARPLRYSAGFPEDLKRIGIGGFASSWAHLHDALGWRPRTSFAEGISRSIDYYRREFCHYLEPGDEQPRCALEVHEAASAAVL